MHEEPSNVSIIQLTQKERPADRFLASNAHTLAHGRREISFISVVEISEAWNPARELGVSIPQTFIRLFTGSTHQSILTKFEDALKGINKLFSDQRTKLNSQINCSLTLVAGDEVYLASVGEVSLLLLRNGRLSHLSADLKDGGNDFTTVTSGELTAADWLFVANQELGSLITEMPISDLNAAAASDLEKFLRHQVSLEDRRTLAGCVVRYAPEAGQLSTIYLDELDSRTPISLPAMPKLSMPRKFNLPNLSKLAAVVPVLQRFWTGAKIFARRLSLRQWLLLGSAAVIIIALFVGINRVRTPETELKAEAPSLVSQFSDVTRSNQRAFAASSITKSSFDALSSADQSQLQNMLTSANITGVPLPKEVATLPATIIAIDSPSVTGELYLLDSTGQVWKWQQQILTKIEQKQLIAQPVSITAFSATKIVVTDVAGNIWYLDGTANQPQSLAIPVKITAGPKLVQKYRTALYIYTATSNQMFRVTNYNKELSSATVVTTSAAITNPPVSDWAVNGDFFTINKQGKILNLRRNVAVTDTPWLPALDGPFYVAATEKNVAVSDGRVLSQLDITTNTIREKLVIADQPFSDIAANNDQGWWIVIEDKLFLLP